MNYIRLSDIEINNYDLHSINLSFIEKKTWLHRHHQKNYQAHRT
jgi:hypothetical protein